MIRKSKTVILSLVLSSFFMSGCYTKKTSIDSAEHESANLLRTVKGLMQVRPGGPLEETEVKVHTVPDDLPLVSAEAATLNDDDLVLGVVADGAPVAYPIRYLAMFEVVDSQAGKLPVAPTW